MGSPACWQPRDQTFRPRVAQDAVDVGEYALGLLIGIDVGRQERLCDRPQFLLLLGNPFLSVSGAPDYLDLCAEFRQRAVFRGAYVTGDCSNPAFLVNQTDQLLHIRIVDHIASPQSTAQQ